MGPRAQIDVASGDVRRERRPLLGEYENREDGLVNNTGWAKFISREIAKAGLSEREFAELVGVAPTTVHNWATNGWTPVVDSLFKISEVLNVPLSTLLHAAGLPTTWYEAHMMPVRIVAKAAAGAKLTTAQAEHVAAFNKTLAD
ncbi:MAG: helix-turn-helix domain-containing protein [Chloroflexota bacterium]